MTLTHLRAPRGASLATVMMVVAMMLTLGFTVVAIAFNHLNLSFKSNNHAKARHLAEAVLAQTIDQIVKDQEYGMLGSAEEKTIRIVPPTVSGELFSFLPADSEGILTFDQDLASSEGIPFSTNNRTEAGVFGAAGVAVPGESFHLVATGRVKNSVSRMEAIVTVPQFPYSVASEGAIQSNGGLLVASVAPGTAYDLNYPIHEDDLRPGHLVSNSKIGGDAVVLSGENKIYGDLQSSSGVTLEEDTAILGEIRTNAADEQLPRLEVTDYDPEFKPGLQVVNSGAGTLEVEGYNKSYGNLTVDNGIELNGGVLYVEGDLLVSAGGVTGKGALISTGDIVIYGDGESHTDNQAALIAEGDIILTGSSSEKAKFAGLIYTEQQLAALNLRLAGVFVAAGDDSEVVFENVEVYEDSSLSVLDLSTPAEPSEFDIPPLTPPTITFDGHTAPTTYDTSGLQANLENFRNPDTSPGQPEYLFKVPFVFSGTGFITHEYDTEGNTFYVDTSGPDPFVVDGSTLGLTIFGQEVDTLEEAQSVTVAGIQAILDGEGRTLTAEEIEELETAAKVAFDSTGAAYFLSQSSAEYTYTESQNDPSEPSGGFDWTLDFSEFFNDGKRMEILYWGEYTE